MINLLNNLNENVYKQYYFKSFREVLQLFSEDA